MRSMPGLSWGALIIRGLLLLALGVLAFIAPGPTLTAFIFLFGAFALVDGVLAVIAGFMSPGGPRWWIVVAGVLGIIIGVLTFVSPNATAVALVLLIGAWSIVFGVGQVLTAWRLRAQIEGEWLYILSGIVSVLFGAYVLVFPGAGALALIWLIGFYAIFLAVMHIYLGWQLRKRVAAAPAMP